MNLLIIYTLIVTLITLLGLVVILNFVRFRFKGDKTIPFLVLFVALFLIDIIFTLSLLDPTSLSNIPFP